MLQHLKKFKPVRQPKGIREKNRRKLSLRFDEIYDSVATAVINNKIINKLSYKALGMTFSSAFDRGFRRQYLLS